MEELLSFAEYEAGHFIFRLFWNMQREEKSLDGKMQALRVLIEVRHSRYRAEARIRSIVLTGRVGVEAEGRSCRTVTERCFLPRIFSAWISVIFFPSEFLYQFAAIFVICEIFIFNLLNLRSVNSGCLLR
jgi:hypothetical protein